jgi:hypothetical protein
VQSKEYTLYALICQWLTDNGYQYDFEDYSDFILLYTTVPGGARETGGRLTIGRGSWATSLLDNGGEKRGIMILKDRIQIGGLGRPHNNEIIEIQAWDPTLFDQLTAYLS